jgi:hypothetical protein
VPKPDDYTSRARIAPVLLVISPGVVFMATSAVAQVKVAFGGATLVALLAVVAAQLGRDRGRALEPGLWQQWGGAPTVRKLRFRGGDSMQRVERHHATVEAATGHQLPTPEDEAADPGAADVAYEDAVSALRELTRDDPRFRLVWAENADYGFRRNTLGLRRWGTLSAAVVLFGALLFLLLSGEDLAGVLTGAGPAAVWSVAMLVFFRVVVTEEWVRVPAEAYADRLLGAAGNIEPR